MLNEGKRKDVLILNWEGTEITQYVVDPNQYLYRGGSIHSKNYPDMYLETSALSNLVFEDGELSIEGFYARYNEWLVRKRRAFDKKIAQIEEEARKQKEREQQRQAEFEKAFRERGKRNATWTEPSVEPCVSVGGSNQATLMSYEERRESILPFIDQQVEQVIDQTGTRWIRCELCGAVETADKFWMFGGVNRVNLGKCYKCNKCKRCFCWKSIVRRGRYFKY